MADRNAPSADWTLIAIGTLTAAAGVYFGLAGFDLVPPPSQINGPIWIALCVGLVFLSAGIAVIVRGALGINDQSSELPAGTPAWLNAIYWLAGLLAAAGLAGIGTWVAFGGGTREFSMSGFISGPLGEGIGRTVFGIGAIMTWLFVAAIAHSGAKKLFGKKN